jgi:serine/threonine-protein kinase
MNLVRKLQANLYARKLTSSGELAEGALSDLQSQLVSLGPDAIRSTLESLRKPEARKPAIDVLQRLLSNDTLPVFLEALRSSEPAIVDGVTEVMSRSQTYDPTRLLELFGDPSISKARLEQILSAQMKSVQPRMLLSILPDMSKDARGVIFRLLEKRADSSVVGEAVRLAVHTEWWLRLHMAKLLARFPSPEGVGAVIKLLKDENRGVRLEAVRCLSKLKAVEAVPSLCARLRDPDIQVQTAAIEALVQIGDVSAVPELLEYLKDEAEYVRRGAVEVLNEVVTTDAIKDLVTALRDADWWVRVRAADALGSLGGPRVVEAVVGLLDEEDDFVRRYAVEILNMVPDRRAVEPLIRALDDVDWWVRERAVDALAKTGDPRAVEPLLRLLNRDTSLVALCIKALATLPDVRSVEPLCRLTASESTEVRREAIHALVQLSRAGLPEDSRSQIASTLEALGVRPSRGSSRPMEMRPRRVETPSEGVSAPGARAPAAAPTGEERRGDAPLPPPVPIATPAAASASGTPGLDYQKLVPGTRLLDRYSVIRRIGGGGFGSVYLAEDVVVKEELVLKVLSPQFTVDENMIRRFVQELKLTRRISHKNVIRIYDLINLGGAHAISMEYFPGRDLAQILKSDGRLPVERVLRIANQVCEGLEAAHEIGIVHRDIKPGNILIGDKDQTKIVDFGLAAVKHSTLSRLTQSGILVGTPEYISPEQITGADVDGRADLYSLAVVMYEMLTGQQPFSGDHAVNVLFQHLESTAQPLRGFLPDLPESVEKLVLLAMSRSPAQRPPSAAAMLDALRAAA